jgi:DNA mismatch endonuclease (patch repair protein)
MTDVFRPEERSRIMSRIRSQGNRTTELRFIRILRTQKIGGWRRGSELPGRPDFVFRRQRVAVFIDGDFWHGNPKKYRCPKSNRAYWRAKIRRNRERDREVNRLLRLRGWKVARFWESSLRNGRTIRRRLRLLVASAHAFPQRSYANARRNP